MGHILASMKKNKILLIAGGVFLLLASYALLEMLIFLSIKFLAKVGVEGTAFQYFIIFLIALILSLLLLGIGLSKAVKKIVGL